ncbi:MAG: molybdenum cofactor biosynthesis protein MoaB [Candidatus Eisenbacteria bacterium]|nr:molybdenum cofactor biosynthesis protein MoaB [Candidatus Eisenbacteria bacterium]
MSAAKKRTTRRPAAKPRPDPSHAAHQRAVRPVAVAIITVSDTRRGADDTSGALAERMLLQSGFTVISRAWAKDEVATIRRATRAALAKRAVDVVILTGGTGVAPRDVTPEAVEPLLERELPGFGERFRALSWAAVGAAAWLSRAGAGVARGRLVVYLPGSSGAVRQALEQLLIPELVHVVRLLGRI